MILDNKINMDKDKIEFKKIVIFGSGRVGIATQKTLNLLVDFIDNAKNLDVNTTSDYDLALICVPTLVKDHNDYENVDECLERLTKDKFNGLVAIRSTLDPKYLKNITKKYVNLNIIHFPEFMKQRQTNHDISPWTIVLGGDKNLTHPFSNWLINNNYGKKEMINLVSLEESSLIKLFQNAALALKVTYANVMYETCNLFNANFEIVKIGVGTDKRIGIHHLDVPGEDGFGFSGHCLPKDLNCLYHLHDISHFWKNVIDINNIFLNKNVKNTN